MVSKEIITHKLTNLEVPVLAEKKQLFDDGDDDADDDGDDDADDDADDGTEDS